MWKVLLAEAIDQAGYKVLQKQAEVVVSPDPSSETVGRLMRDADALIVRTATRVTAAMIAETSRLKVISRTGGGLDNVDVAAATQRGVLVCGVKGPQDRDVAEHTVALLLALAKQLSYLDGQTRSGNFRARFEYRPLGLAGKRIGILGLGRIGREVSGICTRGLAMEAWGYDPYISAGELEQAGVVLQNDMPAVIREADFLTIHVPLTPETRGLIGSEQLKLMKPSAFIINTSRGEMIQETALVEALQSGRIAGAALDVFAQEPPPKENPLFRLPNVVVTPHSAALTREAVAKLAEGAARNAIAALEGHCPPYCPNWEEVHTRGLAQPRPQGGI